MLTTAFLVAGVFSFFVAAAVTVWRLVIQKRDLGELPARESMLGIANAILAMAFFSLGIFRSLQGPDNPEQPSPTPLVEATVAPTQRPSGPTVIIVPFPTTAPSDAAPAPPPTRVPPAVAIAAPETNAAVSTTALIEGTSQGVAPGQVPESEPPWLYVLVRRTDVGTTPSWWVQPYPIVEPDGSWSGFLDEGLVELESGTPFDVCVIVTDELLPTGQRADAPQAFSRDCVSVEAA